MKEPTKCKCGKMISRPKANKSGLCCTCTIKRFGRGYKASPCIKSTNIIRDKQNVRKNTLGETSSDDLNCSLNHIPVASSSVQIASKTGGEE